MAVDLSSFNWIKLILGSDIPPNARYLALYLGSFMNAHQEVAWPSLTRIEKETGLSHATVIKWLKYLSDEKWLTKQSGNSTKSNRYWINIPETILAGVGQQLTQGRSAVDLGVGQQLTSNNNTNNKYNNNIEKFDAFWMHYPKKVEKKKSKAKFLKLKPETQDQIITNVKKRARSDKQWLSGYIPNPTTYLNGERWEDNWESVKKERQIDYV